MQFFQAGNDTKEISLKIYLTVFHYISKVFHEASYVLEKSDLVITDSQNANGSVPKQNTTKNVKRFRGSNKSFN
jgi:hypothetical protein